MIITGFIVELVKDELQKKITIPSNRGSRDFFFYLGSWRGYKAGN